MSPRSVLYLYICSVFCKFWCNRTKCSYAQLNISQCSFLNKTCKQLVCRDFAGIVNFTNSKTRQARSSMINASAINIHSRLLKAYRIYNNPITKHIFYNNPKDFAAEQNIFAKKILRSSKWHWKLYKCYTNRLTLASKDQNYRSYKTNEPKYVTQQRRRLSTWKIT